VSAGYRYLIPLIVCVGARPDLDSLEGRLHKSLPPSLRRYTAHDAHHVIGRYPKSFQSSPSNNTSLTLPPLWQ
jgi:hypothetical protein